VGAHLDHYKPWLVNEWSTDLESRTPVTTFAGHHPIEITIRLRMHAHIDEHRSLGVHPATVQVVI
jgi:hypothetical protein